MKESQTLRWLRGVKGGAIVPINCIVRYLVQFPEVPRAATVAPEELAFHNSCTFCTVEDKTCKVNYLDFSVVDLFETLGLVKRLLYEQPA